jgi:hypothetical protein
LTVLPGAPETLTLPYRWAGVDGAVQAEVGVNDDPAALGCSEFARGFPYCRATVTPPAAGYAEALGWVQLIEWTHIAAGFRIDPFLPLGEISHPFGFFGFAPTLFDAPHTDDERRDSDFIAHSFLCGLGGELLEFRREARAVLGFSWGFSIRDREFEIFGPAVLGPEEWDRHHDYLRQAHPAWSFASGFAEGP